MPNYRAAPTATNPKNLELASPQSVTATRLDQLVYSPNCYIQTHLFPRIGYLIRNRLKLKSKVPLIALLSDITTSRDTRSIQHTDTIHTYIQRQFKTKMCHIHTPIVSRYLATRGTNKILPTHPPHINMSEDILSRITPHTLPISGQINHPFCNTHYTSGFVDRPRQNIDCIDMH